MSCFDYKYYNWSYPGYDADTLKTLKWALPMSTDLSIDFEQLMRDYEAKEKTNKCPKAKKVYYDETAGVTVVLWTDGTKTIVKAAEGDKRDAYLGYCTALAKKIHGTNSALKRDLEKVLVVTTKKKDMEDERCVI